MSDVGTSPHLANVPLGGLPSADTTLLVEPPLEVAIVEVRFLAEAAQTNAAFATELRDALARATDRPFPTIQPATQSTMQVNFDTRNASVSGEDISGWQIATADGQYSATVFPGSLVWQVGGGEYERWSVTMRNPVEILLEAISTHMKPVLTQRIGLRYVDRLVDHECRTPADWSGKVDESLLGPVRNNVFGTKVRSAQQQVDVPLDAQHAALLRHGPINDPTTGSTNYLLDFDVFSHASEAFEGRKIIETAERLNRTALTLFQACLDKDYLKTLQRKEKN